MGLIAKFSVVAGISLLFGLLLASVGAIADTPDPASMTPEERQAMKDMRKQRKSAPTGADEPR